MKRPLLYVLFLVIGAPSVLTALQQVPAAGAPAGQGAGGRGDSAAQTRWALFSQRVFK